MGSYGRGCSRGCNNGWLRVGTKKVRCPGDSAAPAPSAQRTRNPRTLVKEIVGIQGNSAVQNAYQRYRTAMTETNADQVPFSPEVATAVRATPGFMLQSRVGGEPLKARIRTVKNNTKYPELGGSHTKPKGGMWTATLIDEEDGGGSSWTHLFGNPEDFTDELWTLEVDPSARVLVIDSYGDLSAALDKYPDQVVPTGSRSPRYFDARRLDWERVSRDYDAIHISQQGIKDCQGTVVGEAVDIESTLWFRWKFTETAEP